MQASQTHNPDYLDTDHHVYYPVDVMSWLHLIFIIGLALRVGSLFFLGALFSSTGSVPNWITNTFIPVTFVFTILGAHFEIMSTKITLKGSNSRPPIRGVDYVKPSKKSDERKWNEHARVAMDALDVGISSFVTAFGGWLLPAFIWNRVDTPVYAIFLINYILCLIAMLACYFSSPSRHRFTPGVSLKSEADWITRI